METANARDPPPPGEISMKTNCLDVVEMLKISKVLKVPANALFTCGNVGYYGWQFTSNDQIMYVGQCVHTFTYFCEIWLQDKKTHINYHEFDGATADQFMTWLIGHMNMYQIYPSTGRAIDNLNEVISHYLANEKKYAYDYCTIIKAGNGEIKFFNLQYPAFTFVIAWATNGYIWLQVKQRHAVSEKILLEIQYEKLFATAKEQIQWIDEQIDLYRKENDDIQ
jgi:hypothetical protein